MTGFLTILYTFIYLKIMKKQMFDKSLFDFLANFISIK